MGIKAPKDDTSNTRDGLHVGYFIAAAATFTFLVFGYASWSFGEDVSGFGSKDGSKDGSGSGSGSGSGRQDLNLSPGLRVILKEYQGSLYTYPTSLTQGIILVWYFTCLSLS